MIQRLLSGHLTGDKGPEPKESDIERPTVEQAQVHVLNTLYPAGTPPLLQTAALSITRAELHFLDELVPILDTTPRSTKRFVNLYQLVRIIYKLDPKNDPDTSPQEHELMAFVLALGEGLPRLGPPLLKAAETATSKSTFHSIIEKMESDDHEIKHLKKWLTGRNAWKKMPAWRIAGACSKVNRFLFRVGTIDGAPLHSHTESDKTNPSK